MANQKNDESSKVGSLLADLLNDVKAGVAEEQKERESEADRRAREEREARDREEGRKREAAQQRLIEEARRRNEALSKRERGSDRKGLATAPHMRPLSESPQASGPKSAELRLALAAQRGPSKLMLVALVVIGVGLGLGVGMLASPSPRDAGIDVSAAAKAVVAATRKQATAEGKVLMELESARKQIADLQRQVGESEGKHRALAAQFDVLKADFEKTRKELEVIRGADAKGPRRNTNNNSIPNINGSIFNPK